MKRFLSLLATVVLVLQSVATSLVYAVETDGANQEGGESTSIAEAIVEESIPDDESADEALVSEESTIGEVVDEIEILDEFPLDEDMVDESEVENLNEEDEELVEEFTEEVEEIVAESEDVKVERKALSYGKSFVIEQSWTKYSTNGLMVTAVDSLGAFPQGTDMEVTAIEEDEVFDLVNDAIEANVTKVRAVDITFWHDGEEVEPTQPINVTIRALNMTEPQTVVHIDDEENVEEIEADIKGKTAEFEADSFSIYAIVETAILTVNFHNGEETIATVYVKNADEVESLVYDPGIGTEEDGDVFRGWSSVSDYDVNTDGMSIEGVRENIVSNIGETKTLDFYAMIFKHYTVTYQDEDGVVIATDEVLFKGAETQSYEYTITQNYNPKKQDQNFEGWKKVDGGDYLYQHDDKINVDGDITLKASVQEGHWLIFNENGKGATYIAPQFIETNAKTAEPTIEMVRQGYTFGGWYKEAGCTNAFTFGTTIDTGTTIYAKWTPIASANYTVLIWKQNVAGDGYDFEESVSLNGAVGEAVDKVTQQGNGNNAYARVNGSDKKYVGFHLKEFDQNVEIKAEGNSVVNVYYDRNEYTLTFQIKGNGSNWQTIKTIKALYQQSIGSNFPIVGTNGTTYNQGQRWEPQTNSVGLNEVIVYLDTMPAGDVTFHLNTSDASTKTMNYYVEALPGATNTVSYDGKKYTLYNSVKANYNGVTVEDYLDLVGFTKFAVDPSYTYNNGYYTYYVSRKNGTTAATTVNFYYTRQKYPINFMDGRYVDGNNNKLEDHSKEQLTTTDNILYGADITSYNKDGADYYTPTAPAGYVFEGWYLDDACTQKADFTTMPEGGLTVYAKWRQIQYRVFLHPNADGDGTLDWGSENQAMNFRISHGGKVSVPEGRRDEYDFVGWYSDEGLTQSFNADAFVLNEKTVTSDYDKTSDFTDPMDKYGNGATTNSDITGNDGEDRFRITKKLDLYAKWRSKLFGANGMNIVYDAVDGNGEPTDGGLYVDGSEAVAGAASTPSDSNYQFKYWVVQKWNGTEYVDTDVAVYPGESFEVLKANAYVVENENSTEDEPSYTYTIKLRAEYVKKGDNEKTTIQYCPNYEGTNEECTEVELVVNEEHIILDSMFNRGEGYVFDGWKDSEGNEWNVGSGVGADNENPIPNVLNAQWSCDTDYHTEDDGETCVNNKKKVNCVTGTIANGEYVVEEVEVEWNGKTWEETPVCMQVKCDTGYRLNVTENGTTCEPEILEEQSCGEFNIENAKVVNGTFTSQWTENGYTVAPEWSMDGESCTYECEEGFHSEDGKTCVSDKKYVECETGEIANGEYVVERVEIEWNNGWPTTPSCTQIKCDDEYHLNATNNTCEKNIIEGVTCGTLTVDNAEPIVSTFTSVWSGNSYTVAPAWSMNGSECTYDCKDGFHTENMKDCIGNTTGVTCGRVEVEHGESIEAIVEINWNGKTWENVPSCVVKCDTGYRLNVTENGTTCELEILEEQSCGEFNIENAKVVNGTFTSQWTENGYTVAPEWSMDGESCTYECEEGFHSEDGKTCVSNKKYVECETGEIANGEYVVERVEIEWNNGWPTTPACTKIDCDDTYHEENGSCVADEKEEGVECKQEGAPEHATYVVTTGAGTWNGQTYVGNEVCAWECDDTFHEENGACVSDEKEVETAEVCGELAKDSHAYYLNEKQTLTYENGEWSEPVCEAVCEVNYRPIDQNVIGGQDGRIINYDGIVNGVVRVDLPTEGDLVDGNESTIVNNFRCEIMTNTVTFDLNGGKVAEGVETVIIVNSGDVVKEIATSRNGYTFQGWTLDGKEFNFSTPITSDITLVAKWKRNGGGGGSSGGGKPDEEEIELGGEVTDKCSVSGSNLSPEVIAAYLYACENDITTIRDINEARLGDFLTRAEMAKIVSVFATKELGMKPNTSKDCSNFEGSMNGYSQEMRDYMVMSCQLELMGIHTVNYEPIPDFMPNKRVSRAEFGTILSRILWGDSYEGTNSNYYINHLNALKENNIITNIDPNITEYRSWVLLMIYRSVNVIKAGGTKKAESVEQDVNNELKDDENGAFIGLANPASAFCVEQGGENYVVKDAEGNEIGLCKLTDGTVIDEWEYYRNMNNSEKSKDADAETTTSDSQEESTEETNSETTVSDTQEQTTDEVVTDETSGS